MDSNSIQNESEKASPFENKSRLIGVSEQDLTYITCGICRLILEDPVLVGCCQLHYCSQCLDFWINTYNTCPNDGKRLENYGISLPKRTRIKFMDNLKVSCDYQRYGCKEELTRMAFDIHVKYCGYNTCEVCYLKKGFGTPHNCIHALKSKINYLVKENKRLTEETEKAFERSAQLNEENLELENKLKTFTDNSKNTLAEENVELMKAIDYYQQKEMEDKNRIFANSSINTKLDQILNLVLVLDDKLDTSGRPTLDCLD